MPDKRFYSGDLPSRRLLAWVSSSLLLLIGAPTVSAQFQPEPTYLQGAHVRVTFDKLRPLSEDHLLKTAAKNESIPNNPHLAIAAPAFSLAALGAGTASSVSALDCLTAAVYYEAANEAIVGQKAVAQVVLNRVRHPAFPGTVCGVVFQGSERVTGCQFTFACDGSLARRPVIAKWLRARTVAMSALAGSVEPSVGHATHYHASYVLPYWAPNLTKITTIGAHIFYQWQGSWSKPSAFVDRYAFAEELPSKAKVALAGYVLTPLSSDQIIQEVDTEAAATLARSSRSEGLKASYPIAGVEQANAAPDSDASLKTRRTELIESKAQLREDLRDRLSDRP
jgi:spore germination cell wall hydrolase CwlJ-like protein